MKFKYIFGFLIIFGVPIMLPAVLWVFFDPVTFIEKVVMLFIHLVLIPVIFMSICFVIEISKMTNAKLKSKENK